MPNKDLPGRGARAGGDLLQLPENTNTSVTDMAEYLAAEVMRDHPGITPRANGAGKVPFVWIEHYPRDEAQRRVGLGEEWDLITFSDYEIREVRTATGWRPKIGKPEWEPLGRARVEKLVGGHRLDEREPLAVAATGGCRTPPPAPRRPCLPDERTGRTFLATAEHPWPGTPPRPSLPSPGPARPRPSLRP